MSIYGPYSSVESTPSLSAAVPVIDEGGGEYAPRLVWGSDDGTEVHSSWEISIGVTGYRRGDANGGAAFAVDGTSTKTVGASGCYSHKDSQGRHVWACPLADLVPNYLSDPATYENRKCDALVLTATLTELATGARYSKTGTVKLNYRPQYVLEAFRYVSSATAVVEYSTTWTRTDDRFHFWAGRSTMAVSSHSTAAIGGTEQYGSVAFDASSGTGVVALDATKFDRVAIGAECKLQLTFNQSISVASRTVTQTLACEDGATCDGLDIEIGTDGFVATVIVSADGTTGNEPDAVTVTLVGGTLPGDTVELDYAAGETVARFHYVPLDVEVTFQAVGSRDPGDGGAEIVSAVSSKAATVESNGCRVLDCVESGAQATLEYKMQDGDYGDLSLSIDSDEIQLAGRSRPSRYPTGSSTLSIDFEGAFEGDDDGGWRDVAEGGLCVLRFPGGGRWPVAVESVDTSHLLGDYTEISVSCEEVDWR